MARKPKAAPVADTPQAARADLPVPNDAPAPVRRGRKPKVAAASSQPITTAANGNAVAQALVAAAANTAIMDERAKPIRARLGRKPKQSIDDAATLLLQDDGQEQSEARADQPEAMQPTLDEGDTSVAEMDVHGAVAEGGSAPSGDTDPDKSADDALLPSLGLDAVDRAKPAAHWNRETDAVQFYWPEIERTASQEGPNQVMAKLLVAARAEGANSRWPL